MDQVKFKIGKCFIRGERKGKRVTEVINLNCKEDIHSFLWDTTDLFDRNRCNYIVEWYLLK